MPQDGNVETRRTGSVLTPRWTPLLPHAQQIEAARCNARFIVGVCGRRSGKTEILLKRRCIERALSFKIRNPKAQDWWGVLAAPTRDQAKRLFWNDLKLMIPKWALKKRPMEADLTVQLINGAEITVIGMDKPERIEGKSLDWFGGDEFANMKEQAWRANIRPALSTIDRPGEAVLTGVPEGRNHFYKMAEHAQSGAVGWAYFHWPSEEILSMTEQGREDLAEAKRTLDPLTYDQEYNANFINFEGRAYYAFDRQVHANKNNRVTYRPGLPLIFCFDFNNKPGVCAVLQEHDGMTCGVGEVWVPQNSNTEIVCRKLAMDWHRHQGLILIYGDATGGAKTTTAVAGSDWDIVYKVLKPVFKDQLKMRQRKSNPPERVRINAVNARLKTADGNIHARFDYIACKHLIEDLDSVTLVEGGSGELDKHSDKEKTHISDAFGYYIAECFPITTRDTTQEVIY